MYHDAGDWEGGAWQLAVLDFFIIIDFPSFSEESNLTKGNWFHACLFSLVFFFLQGKWAVHDPILFRNLCSVKDLGSFQGQRETYDFR